MVGWVYFERAAERNDGFAMQPCLGKGSSEIVVKESVISSRQRDRPTMAKNRRTQLIELR